MEEVFDYIVVGAGSAGCVMAARLSEDAAVRVLLIEAGGRDRHPFFKMPLAWLRATTLGRHLWAYRSEPEPALNGRQLDFVRGRVLGGTSTINGMIYARGHPLDYDDWETAGLDGWSFREVLPWFQRLERSWRGAGELHGDAGPVGVSRPRVPGMHFHDWAAAAREVGIAPVGDLAAGDGAGISEMELTVANGLRVSSASAYLRTAATRANLSIRTGVEVYRIDIVDQRASGVSGAIAGAPVRFKARREVIVCAGTYGSPALLMNSGVGPAQELRSNGVVPKVDRAAVGKHLKEHVILPVGFRARHNRTFLRELRVDRLVGATLRWTARRDGPLATNGVGGNIYVKSLAGLDRPDIRLICGTIGPTANVWTPFDRKRPAHEFMCVVNLLHPKSEGQVSLRSAKGGQPRIQFNLLSHPDDRAAMIRGVRIARSLFETEALGRHAGDEWTPGAVHNDDQALDAHLSRMAAIGQHPVGTCRMGKGDDAVVDARLRVHGVDALRVVDASVFPDQIGGNPSVPVMMIAERAAAFIKSGE